MSEYNLEEVASNTQTDDTCVKVEHAIITEHYRVPFHTGVKHLVNDENDGTVA